MYAIAFDLVISDLKKHYGEPYHNAYSEIKKVLLKNKFYSDFTSKFKEKQWLWQQLLQTSIN